MCMTIQGLIISWLFAGVHDINTETNVPSFPLLFSKFYISLCRSGNRGPLLTHPVYRDVISFREADITTILTENISDNKVAERLW